MLNSVNLMGRLTADPELRTTENKKSVTSFSIAVERNYASKGQEREVDFIDVVAWNQTAEFIAKYFAKGALIAIQGELRTRTYTANDGSTRKSVEVLADKAFFSSTKTTSTGNAAKPAAQENNEKPEAAEEEYKLPWEDDEE